jgi:hypothetical protein
MPTCALGVSIPCIAGCALAGKCADQIQANAIWMASCQWQCPLLLLAFVNIHTNPLPILLKSLEALALKALSVRQVNALAGCGMAIVPSLHTFVHIFWNIVNLLE